MRPTSVEPVKAILSTPLWLTRWAPVVPSPHTISTTPAGNAAQGVNKIEGIKATPPNAVQPIPPPPAGAVSTIRAVQGVQGIIAPKQLNLEAALLIKPYLGKLTESEVMAVMTTGFSTIATGVMVVYAGLPSMSAGHPVESG